MQKYCLLETQPLPEGATCYHPERQNALVHHDAPALEVFTDFKSKAPVIITPDKLTSSALEKMKQANVKSLLVINDQEQVIGFISARLIQGAYLGHIANLHSVPLKEVTVEMAMLPYEKVLSLPFNTLSNVCVGHIVRLMHELGTDYILVTEPHPEDPEQNMIRGLFSASRISLQLGQPVTGDLSSHSLADINRRIP